MFRFKFEYIKYENEKEIKKSNDIESSESYTKSNRKNTLYFNVCC